MSNRLRGEVRRTLRVPADINAWLENQSARNGASLNSEIVRCVRERMDRMGAPLGASSGNDDETQGLGNRASSPSAFIDSPVENGDER